MTNKNVKELEYGYLHVIIIQNKKNKYSINYSKINKLDTMFMEKK